MKTDSKNGTRQPKFTRKNTKHLFRHNKIAEGEEKENVCNL